MSEPWRIGSPVSATPLPPADRGGARPSGWIAALLAAGIWAAAVSPLPAAPAADAPALIQRLQTATDPGDRRAAIEALAALREASPELRPALRRALGDPDPAVRVTAAWGLARLGGAAGKTILEETAARARPPLRLRAMRGLHLLGDPTWLPEIEASYDPRDPAGRREVVAALLEESRGPFAAPTIARAILAPDAEDAVVAEAARVLEKSGDPAAPAVLRSAFAARFAASTPYRSGVFALAAALRRLDPSSPLPDVEEALTGPGPAGAAKRYDAAAVLSELARSGDAWALLTLTRALEAPARDAKAAAVFGLAQAQARSALPALLEAARDPEVRAEVADALATLGDESALPALADLLKDGDGGVRLRAVTALTAIGGPGARALLRAAYLRAQAEKDADEAQTISHAMQKLEVLARFGGNLPPEILEAVDCAPPECLAAREFERIYERDLGGGRVVLVLDRPRSACGAQNCPLWMFQKRGQRYVKVFEGGGASWEFLPVRTRGYPDVRTTWHGGAATGTETIYRWNGTEYRAAGTRQVVFVGGEGDTPAAWARRALALLRKGDLARAIEILTQTVKAEPPLAVAYRHLGDAYRAAGKPAEARAAYERYLRLAPGATDAPLIRRRIRELGGS